MSRNRRGGIAASEDDDRRTEQTSDQDEDESLHALVKWDELGVYGTLIGIAIPDTHDSALAAVRSYDSPQRACA